MRTLDGPGDRRPAADGDDERAGVVAAANRSLPLALLAAGAGTRMGPGPHKLLREVAGQPLLVHALDRITRCGDRIDPLLLVVAPGSPYAIAGLAHAAGATVVVAPRAHEGMAWSLNAACLAAMGNGLHEEHAGPATAVRDDGRLHPLGLLVALADDPLALDDLPAVLDAVARDATRPVGVDRRSAPHPVWVPASIATSFQPDPGHPERGLGAVLRGGDMQVVAAGAPSLDVDVPGDLARLADALTR